MKRGRLLLGVLGIFLAVLSGGLIARAAEVPQGEFNLQVTPSPLVATIKPGTKTTLELKVRNGGTATEHLKIEPRSFTLDSESEQVRLDDTTPPPIAPWISFSEPQFTVRPGQWITQQITFDVPEDAGFSYSFVLVISRQEDPQPDAGQAIRGSVAVFTLINVDRPDATNELEVVNFGVSKRLYEYLPASFSIRFRNTGNTIVQPYGNIFIGRSDDDKEPLGSLVVNETKGYILPGTERTIEASWTDGFPAYQTVQNADGTTSQKLTWDWSKVSSLRIGRYTAKLVAVYSQNGRDVPIEGTVSFWVIPWKILLVLLVIVLLVLFAIFMLIRMVLKAITRRASKKAAPTDPSKH